MLTWSWLILTLILGPGMGFGLVEASLMALFFDWLFRLIIKGDLDEKKSKLTKEEIDAIDKDARESMNRAKLATIKDRSLNHGEYTEADRKYMPSTF